MNVCMKWLTKIDFKKDFKVSLRATAMRHLVHLVLLASSLRIKVCFKTLATWIIKLHNFSNIWSRSIIETVLERFWRGNTDINRKFKNFQKSIDPNREEKGWLFPMGYMRPKILCLTLLLVSFLYNKKNLWNVTIQKIVMILTEVLRKFSHIYIYSVMHDFDTDIPEIICGFHSKRFKTLWFSRTRNFKVSYVRFWKLEVPWGKSSFPSSRRTTEISCIFKFSV